MSSGYPGLPSTLTPITFDYTYGAAMASSHSGSQTTSDPVRLSFGVELEFLVAYLPYGWEPDDDADENMPKAIRMDEDPYPSELWCCQDILEDAIREVNLLHVGGVNRVFGSGEEGCWGLTTDSSLVLPNWTRMSSKGTYLGARWVPIEIQSPALWDEPESWDEVRKVCQVMKEKFWTIVPSCTGLHFHVGAGQDYLSPKNLRRTAALLLAADPILAQLHLSHRKHNRYCLSNRYFSAVAQGRTASQAKTRLDAVDRDRVEAAHEEQELVIHQKQRLRSPESADPGLEARAVLANTRFDRKIARGQLTGYAYTPGKPAVYPCGEDDYLVPPPIPLYQCVQELTNAISRGAIELLMQGATQIIERPAYNFTNFTEAPYSQRDRKRTVEFRQTAGSLEAEEVLAYGKMHVNLCRFAIDSTPDHFWSVVNKCIATDQLHMNGQPSTDFDAFDLLLLIGLDNEATDLQKVIQARQPDLTVTRGGDDDRLGVNIWATLKEWE